MKSTGAVLGLGGAGLGTAKPKYCGTVAPKVCPLHPRADSRLAGSGQELPAKVLNVSLHPTHCLPCPPDTAGLPSNFVWEGI
eukprot:1152835-Pelagomonas_calceolata.AAC.1